LFEHVEQDTPCVIVQFVVAQPDVGVFHAA
jgi:hypothetical protein